MMASALSVSPVNYWNDEAAKAAYRSKYASEEGKYHEAERHFQDELDCLRRAREAAAPT